MLYKIAIKILKVALVVFKRWEVFGKDNLPLDGGVIITSNHSSYWDPIIVGSACSREVNFMAKEELFNIPVLGFLIKRLNAFPVKRNEADRTAIRKALVILKNKEVVGIFPEGARNEGELLEPHLGVGLLALKAKVPVLPVAIYGSKGLFGKVIVSFSKPLYWESDKLSKEGKTNKEIMSEISFKIMEEIKISLEEIETKRALK